MAAHIISSFRVAMVNSCAECDMGVLVFAAKYKGNASEPFHLCVTNLCWMQKSAKSVASQLLLSSSKSFSGARKLRASLKEKKEKEKNKVPVEPRSLQELSLSTCTWTLKPSSFL